MANTIEDLYLKYVNKVGRTLEHDRYFQYLFEMVQSGSNTLYQTNQVLHKVVDERWLSTIEDSLDAINNIIDKPRRFVTTNEELVPVALARKISSESVRHLSMNTQFIASDENGEVHPTKILNVSTDESYDLYENRFIYHLIQRLVTFIDKRTDVIFWSTGDEKRNKLSMESKVEDAYEEIEYKIEMTIKNRQSFAENDSENMQVFMRIDRVRRLVMALRNSAFCSLMAGCAKVRSPIQRTNLMMKDPNYRTCYKLWQFLESYDDVGYTIEEQDTALEFDEEYLFQLYTNMITNYTVFKSLTESDGRQLSEELAKRRKVMKPKFIKKIEEQVVDDYNLPDVEIRKVIIEEVTERQLELEKELAEETEKLKAETEAREDAEIRAQKAQWDLMAQQQALSEAEERARQELEKTRAAAAKELEEAKLSAARELEEKISDAAKVLKEVREQAARELEEAKASAARELEEAKASAAHELEEAKASAARELEEARIQAARDLKETKERTNRELEETKAQAALKLEAVMSETSRKLQQAEAREQEALRQAAEEAAARCRLEEQEAARRKAEETERLAREKAAAEEQERIRQAEEEARSQRQERERIRQERLREIAGNPEENLSNVIENLSRRNRSAAYGRRSSRKTSQK